VRARAHNLRDKPFHVVKAIDSWAVREALSPFAEGLVTLERRELGLVGDAAIDTAFLTSNVASVLATYRRWLTYLEAREAKGFSISPIWSVRSHFINLDFRATYALLKAEGHFAGNEAACRAEPMPAIEAAFNLGKLTARSDLVFSGLLETDGVALCVHFRRNKTAAEVAADEQREQGRAKSKLEAADRKAARARRLLGALALRADKKARRAEAAAARRDAQERGDDDSDDPEDPPQQ